MKGVLTLFKKFQRSIAHFAYDNPTTRFLFIKAIIERTLAKEKLDANGIYLDIGCDKGYASIVLYETFSEIINLDLNKRAIESCKENCESRGINAHFVVADASVLPFKNSCINVITAFSLIEHLRNQHDFVCEVSRIVGDKGVFIMQFPNRNFFLELHTGMPFPALIPRRIWKLYCRHFLKITHELHIQNLTSNEATRICRPLFSHIRIEKCNYTEENIPPNIRMIYGFLEKIKILHMFPLGWILFCIKDYVKEKQRDYGNHKMRGRARPQRRLNKAC